MRLYYFRGVYSDNIKQHRYWQRGFIKAKDRATAVQIFGQRYPAGYQLTELTSIAELMNNDVIHTLQEQQK